MPALTRFVLRHKAMVALLWLVVAVAGALTVGGTTHRMTNDFAMPGQAFKVDNQIVRGVRERRLADTVRAGADRGRPGSGSTDPAVAAETGRVFAAVPASRFRTPLGSPITPRRTIAQFLTRDGRSTFALVYTRPATGFGGPDAGAPSSRVRLTAPRRPGWNDRGDRLSSCSPNGKPGLVEQGHRR